jgi:hypothetical protein
LWRLDTATVTVEALRGSDAFAVVDAAEPFQGAQYRLAEAALAAGMHYVDLGEARDFAAGFGALDPQARAAGLVALSGASSTPALSDAVLERLTLEWRQLDTVEIAISPGNHNSPRGLSVVQAILSYAGRPVRVFVDGVWTEWAGWGRPIRREMSGLGKRWLSLCETPDLDLVPAPFAPRAAAIFPAGLELSVMHLGLHAASHSTFAAVTGRVLPEAEATALCLRRCDRLIDWRPTRPSGPTRALKPGTQFGQDRFRFWGAGTALQLSSPQPGTESSNPAPTQQRVCRPRPSRHSPRSIICTGGKPRM